MNPIPKYLFELSPFSSSLVSPDTCLAQSLSHSEGATAGPWDLASATCKQHSWKQETVANVEIALHNIQRPAPSLAYTLAWDLLSVASAAAILRAEKCICCNPFLTCTGSVLYLTDPRVRCIWGLSSLGQNNLDAGFSYQMLFQSRSFQYKSFMIALISLVNFLLDLPFFYCPK